jgi:hypothetical protein
MTVEGNISVCFSDDEIGSAQTIYEVLGHFKNLKPKEVEFLGRYAGCQFKMRSGNIVKAANSFNILARIPGFSEYYTGHGNYFKVIELLVTGRTHFEEDS